MNDLNKVESIIKPVLEGHGYELYSINFSMAKDGGTLSIVIDRESPISLDDIVAISEPVSDALDKEDPIQGAYTLDISSLGAEKPIKLERLPNYVGSYVNLHLSHPFKGENILEGEIAEIKDETLYLKVRDKSKTKTISFPLGDVDKARLAIKF